MNEHLTSHTACHFCKNSSRFAHAVFFPFLVQCRRKKKNKETPFFLTIPFLLSRKAHLWARHLATYPFPDLRLFFCFFFPQITFVLFRSELSIFLRHLFRVTTEYQIIPDWLWGLTLFWKFRVFFFVSTNFEFWINFSRALPDRALRGNETPPVKTAVVELWWHGGGECHEGHKFNYNHLVGHLRFLLL